MGRPKGSTNKKIEQQIQTANVNLVGDAELAWGAKVTDANQIATYDNKNFTFKGEIKGYDYEKILRDKQKYIYELYALSDYFLRDALYRGIIENVYVPFSLSSGWKLLGASEKTKTKYYDFYKSIGFGDIARSIFLQLYKYENVFIYMKPSGSLMTLPVHKIRVSDISANGEPVIELNVMELKNVSSIGGMVNEKFIKTMLVKYDGYPDEVKEAIKSGSGQWIQLNPENTFYLGGLKEDWTKYAIPMVSSCLEPFAKKALISNYENSMLNFGMKSFLHIRVGSKDMSNLKIDQKILDENVETFKRALSGFPLAVTNWMVDSEFKFVDTKTLFDKNKYSEVNSDILSAGGISQVVVSGNGEKTSFASAQISIQTVAQRLKQFTNNFAEMMNKINFKLAGILGVTSNKIPEFKFNEIDLSNDGKFQEACFKLWQQGVLSNQTLLSEYHLDYEQERERKKKELDDGDVEIFTLPPSFNNQTADPSNPNATPGAPTKPVSQSKQDKNNSQDNPKPSTQ